jgi:hypothetical protein
LRTKLSARLLLCAALAGSASLVAVVVPGGIASAAPLTVTCTHLTGTISSQSLTGCTGGGAIAADAGVSPAHGTNVVATKTVTWGSGKTSKTTYTYTSVTDNCVAPAGYTKDLKEHETGHVNAGVAGGTAVGMRGGVFSGYACVFKLTAAPHTLKIVNMGNFTV